MKLKDFQRKLKDEYNENFQDAFRDLKHIFDKKEGIRDEVINLNADRIELEKDNRKNSLTFEEYDIRKKRIRNNAFRIIDSISKEQADEFINAHSIFQQILVICKTQPRVEEMKRLLPEHIYPNCTYKLVDSISDTDNYDSYNLVILDDEPHDESDASINNLVEQLIPATKDTLYFLYFGPSGGGTRGYPTRLNFTNSVFSFHARIDEMIQYLKIMRTPTPTAS